MTTRAKAATAALVVLAIAGVVVFLVRDTGPLSNILETKCPLTGLEAGNRDLTSRPAVAVKVENNPVAYPLSGLERAELVYEEVVEGGSTRFMAFYHCTDAAKVGPVRSARIVDPAIMKPIGRILADAGANETVRDILEREGIVEIDESAAGRAMRRIPRPGLASEHTLYANTRAVRAIGEPSFDDPPPDALFDFGELEGTTTPATSVTINFGGGALLRYRWRDGKWLRIERGEVFETESGQNLAVTNVVVQEHTVNLSRTIRDVRGAPSVEIENPTGSGRAALFRNGRAVLGRWRRDSEDKPVVFETADGRRMVFAPGTIWIELVPNRQGDVKGSFSYG